MVHILHALHMYINAWYVAILIIIKLKLIPFLFLH